MRTLSLALGLAALLLASSAHAESTKEAMQTFGMVGVWSLDCARSFKIVYAVPMFGPPTVTSVVSGEERVILVVNDAVMVTEEKIKLSYFVQTAPGAPNWGPQPGETWEAVYQRYGKGFRPLSIKQSVGSKVLVADGIYYTPEYTGKPTLPFEKCLE